MALTKKDIVDNILRYPIFERADVLKHVESIMEIMRETLANGEDILISGFGKFCVKEKKERKGRNPATGEAMMLRARRIVTFKPSGNLRQKTNGTYKYWWQKEEYQIK